jgi:plasmid segregation protein ParM
MQLRCYGVDAGYGWTKLVGEGKRFKFPSLVGTARKRNIEASGINGEFDNLHVRIEGKGFGSGQEFFVGKLAEEAYDGGPTLNVEKVDTSAILIFTALALANNHNSSPQIWLATGLPIAHYRKQKVLLEQRLLGNYEVRFLAGKYQNKRVCLTIADVTIIPQGAGAAFSQVFDEQGIAHQNELTSSRIACVDIGYKTTDFIVLDKLAYLDKLSGSLPLGIVDAHKAILKRLSEEGHELFISDLEKMSLDAPEYQAVARQIEKNIRPYISEGIEVLLAGGGANQLSKYMRGKVVPCPEYANAEGYCRIILAQRRQRYGL